MNLKNIISLMLLLTTSAMISMECSEKCSKEVESQLFFCKSQDYKICSQKLLDLPEEMLDNIFRFGICLELFEKLDQIRNIFDFCQYFNFDIYPDQIETIDNFYKHIKFNINYWGQVNVDNFIKFRSTCKRFDIISHGLIKKIKTKFIQLKKDAIKDFNLDYDGLNKTLKYKLDFNGLDLEGLKYCCKLIFAGADVNCKDNLGGTVLLWAAIKGQAKIVKLLLAKDDIDINVKNYYCNSALLWSARQGYTEIVKLLLAKSGININIRDSYNNTALTFAALEGYIEIVKLLLAKDGIDINAKNNDGNTALIWAAMEGNTEVVKLLLKKSDIDFKAKNIYGNNVLAVARNHGHKKITEILSPYLKSRNRPLMKTY